MQNRGPSTCLDHCPRHQSLFLTISGLQNSSTPGFIVCFFKKIFVFWNVIIIFEPMSNTSGFKDAIPRRFLRGKRNTQIWPPCHEALKYSEKCPPPLTQVGQTQVNAMHCRGLTHCSILQAKLQLKLHTKSLRRCDEGGQNSAKYRHKVFGWNSNGNNDAFYLSPSLKGFWCKVRDISSLTFLFLDQNTSIYFVPTLFFPRAGFCDYETIDYSAKGKFFRIVSGIMIN